jgi:uncharacterized protein YbjQ (UPF0145 family)
MSSDREQLNLHNLESGGLPVAAEERLRAKPFFVANLSVNELALVGRTGYEPVGQVMGCSVYWVGVQLAPVVAFEYTKKDGFCSKVAQSGEREALAAAHSEARKLASDRLLHEARLLGAHGVVGVRLERKTYQWGDELIDFTIRGTAIRIHGQPPTDAPFLCDLSGEQFYQLWRAGYQPVAFVYGNCFWYEIAKGAAVLAQGVAWGALINQELVEYGCAIKHARDIAVQRMEEECRSAGADGVVGVQIERHFEISKSSDRLGDLTVSMEVTGTAIARRAGEFPQPSIVVALQLGRDQLFAPGTAIA